MTSFSVNPQRFDPYKQFKFRVRWDGRYVAGVSCDPAAALAPRWPHIARAAIRTCSASRRGVTSFDPITLERGRTHDAEFEQWANKV